MMAERVNPICEHEFYHDKEGIKHCKNCNWMCIPPDILKKRREKDSGR